jgi:hypothetical protein
MIFFDSGASDFGYYIKGPDKRSIRVVESATGAGVKTILILTKGMNLLNSASFYAYHERAGDEVEKILRGLTP